MSSCVVVLQSYQLSNSHSFWCLNIFVTWTFLFNFIYRSFTKQETIVKDISGAFIHIFAYKSYVYSITCGFVYHLSDHLTTLVCVPFSTKICKWHIVITHRTHTSFKWSHRSSDVTASSQQILTLWNWDIWGPQRSEALEQLPTLPFWQSSLPSQVTFWRVFYCQKLHTCTCLHF